MSRTSYRKELKQFNDRIKQDLSILRTDPHFQCLIALFDQSRMRFYRAAAFEGMPQKDQDKLLGAARALDEIYNLVTQDITGDVDDTGG